MKICKRLISVLLCLVLFFSTVAVGGEGFAETIELFSAKVSAEDAPTSGTCGENLYWSFDADKYTLTISGTGDMYNYGCDIDSDFFSSLDYQLYGLYNIYMNNPVPWDMFRTQIRKIDIQPGCTSVGDFAFFRCWYVGGIVFPEGITRIGSFIFGNSIICLSKVYFPSTLESMGEPFCAPLNGATYYHRLISCYGGNEELVDLGYAEPFQIAPYCCNAKVFGDYILDVDEQTKTAEIVAYVGCDEQIDIPQKMGVYTITGIGFFSFYNCVFLKSVTIPETVVSIKCGAFQFSGVESFYIPKNVSKIGEVAFLSVESNYCVDDVGYPDASLQAGEGSDYYVLSNGEPAYSLRLNSIVVDTQNHFFSSDECGVLYNKDKTVLYQYPIGCGRQSFVIPPSVNTVFNYAFAGGSTSESGLRRVYIPKSVYFLACDPFDVGMILDYAGSQTEWNNIVASSYPLYPEIPNRNNNYSEEYQEYLILNNDMITKTQNYNYYYELWDENVGYRIDHCTINFNVTDPMNGVTPDSITYNWSDDGKSCTGVAVYNDFNSTVTEDASVSSSVYSNATCTQSGTTRYTATFNNTVFSTQYKNVNDISALGHLKSWVVTKAATCIAEGLESYKCSRCQTVFETRKIDKLPHSYSLTVISPTCTQGGYTVHTCSSCGDTYTDSFTNALGHKYTDYITKPTCTTQGYTLHYCYVCKTSYKDNYTDPAHTPGNPVVENATNSSCDVEGGYDEVVYCTICGEEISRERKTTVAGQHTPSEAVKENVVAATCKKVGSYDSVVYCAICKNEISRQTVTIPKLSHKDTNNDGMCDSCKTVIDEAKYKAYLFGKVKFNVKSGEVYKDSKVTVTAKASNVPDGYFIAIFDGNREVERGDRTSVTYEIPELITQNKTLTAKIVDAKGNVQKDGNGKDLSEKIEIKVKTGFINNLVAFFKKLFGANKVAIRP